MKLTTQKFLLPFAAIAALAVSSADAALIAGVDFEDGSGGFDRTPDNFRASSGITTSSGTSGSVYQGWNLGGNGNLRNDAGANLAGAFEGNFPARLQDPGAFWSITIPVGVFFDLDNVTFATRGATGGSGRDIDFTTSLDGGTLLYDNDNLPGRNTGWTLVSLDLTDTKYKGLTNTTIDFIWSSPNAADLDAIRINGVVYIPEPSSLALIGLGSLALIFRRRR